MKINILGQTGESREDDVDYQLTQNWYPSIEQTGKSNLVLYPTPGLTLFADIGTGPIRGSVEYNDLLYIVSADKLYEVASNGAATERGTLNTSTGRVNFAHNGANNGQQLMMVDGTNGYIWDSGASSFAVIADADYPDTATHVEFMDGYFIVNDPTNSGRFYISDSYDGTAWNGLNFATAERSPDDLNSIIVANRILWLIGKKTAEPWFSSGSTFPFEPIQSGFSQWGCVAPYSVVEMNGSAFWLSSNKDGDGLVVMTEGTNPRIVSTQNIATEISKLTTLSTAYAWAYQYQQHHFYVLTFPTDGKTFVYDVSTNMWHQWASATINYHRSNNHVFMYGKHLIGDPINGRVYQLDWSKYTDNGDTITRKRRSQYIHNNDKALRHYGLWIDFKEGVGNVDATDPQVQLRWRDGNGAWSSGYTRAIMGATGETNVKAIFRRLGRSYGRVYEITVTDPVNAVIIDAYAKVGMDAREFG